MNRKTEFCPVGTLPPVHVTFSMTASWPERRVRTCIFHGAGAGSNELIEKPGGTESSIFVVGLSLSVGTDSVNCCSSFDSATSGLITAYAGAPAGRARAPTTAAPSVSFRPRSVTGPSWFAASRARACNTAV